MRDDALFIVPRYRFIMSINILLGIADSIIYWCITLVSRSPGTVTVIDSKILVTINAVLISAVSGRLCILIMTRHFKRQRILVAVIVHIDNRVAGDGDLLISKIVMVIGKALQLRIGRSSVSGAVDGRIGITSRSAV